MHIVLLGANTVSQHLARHLLKAGHDVVMVDEDANSLLEMGERLDVQTVHGRGCEPQVLREAGAARADMLVAMTNNDEVNLLACQMAYSLFRTPRKIARVKNDAYIDLKGSDLYTSANLPVDVLIFPEMAVAEMLKFTLMLQGAVETGPLFGGKWQMVATVLPEATEFPAITEIPHDARLLAIYRGHRLILADKNDHLEAHDLCYFACPKEKAQLLLSELGHEPDPNASVLVIGGGRVGGALARMFEQAGHSRAKIIETDLARAKELAEELKKTKVLHGQGLDTRLLEQEGIASMRAVAYTTADDRTNLLGSALAQQLGAHHVIALVSDSQLFPLAESLGVQNIMCPQDVTVSQVLKYVRHCDVRQLFTLHDDAAEVLEVRLGEDAELVGEVADDLEGVLPKDVRLEMVKRGDTIMRPSKAGRLQESDMLLLVGPAAAVRSADELF